MDELEPKELKEFWGSFGFYRKKFGKRMSGGRYHDHWWEHEIDDIRWMTPDDHDYGYRLPQPTLNSMFKHAVPKVVARLEEDYGWEALREFFKRWMHKMGEQSDHLEHVDFDLALYEVIKENWTFDDADKEDSIQI